MKPEEKLLTLKAKYPDMPEARIGRLTRAIELGATDEILEILCDATRTSQLTTIVLPADRLEGLSRGRGWARKGKGSNVEWAPKAAGGGYRAGPGRWSVGATDGFYRKSNTDWDVELIQVGSEFWTVAQ